MPFMLLQALGGAAKAGGAAIAQSQKNKQEEKIAKINRTDPGVVDFSTDMATSPANLTVSPQRKPLFPRPTNV